ncbi:MAG: radical SAM protein [Syntrophaceae bacterium]|nr:radical SAM protein [Syntrophaceae bacterium]
MGTIVPDLGVHESGRKRGKIIRNFFLSQSLMNADMRWLAAFAGALLDARLDIFGGGNAHINSQMTSGYLDTLFRAGCRELAFGVESASQHVLDRMKKGVSVETLTRVLKDSAQAGIWVHTYWILGAPAETREDLLQTIDFFLGNHRPINSYRFYPHRPRSAVESDHADFADYVSKGSANRVETSEYFSAHASFFNAILKVLRRRPPDLDLPPRYLGVTQK